MKSEWKTAEFTEKFPLGYLPAFEDGELRLNESAAIAEYGEFGFVYPFRIDRGLHIPSPRPFLPFMMRPILSYPCLN